MGGGCALPVHLAVVVARRLAPAARQAQIRRHKFQHLVYPPLLDASATPDPVATIDLEQRGRARLCRAGEASVGGFLRRRSTAASPPIWVTDISAIASQRGLGNRGRFVYVCCTVRGLAATLQPAWPLIALWEAPLGQLQSAGIARHQRWFPLYPPVAPAPSRLQTPPGSCISDGTPGPPPTP